MIRPHTQTSFAAGEVAPDLLGRPDLRLYGNGARTLTNVQVLPTGGLRRRAGLAHVADLPGTARLLPFAFNTAQVYLLALLDGALRVFRDDELMAVVAAPWTGEMLPRLAWTQDADTLILCHPDLPPQRLTRLSHTSWTLAPFAFRGGGTKPVRQPCFKFAAADVTLQPSATAGTVTLTASAALFDAGHAGLRFRLKGREVQIATIASATAATATVIDTLVDTLATEDWVEPAFSDLHGWPATALFHQDRLAFGGSRDLPNRLWLSRIGGFEDFELGEGLADDAIEIGLAADQVNAIVALAAARHLQVFTSGAEWMVSGMPLTPEDVLAQRQTRIGSSPGRTVPPVTVDGVTLFVGRGGDELREFAYTDVEGAYTATDLALLAPHLVHDIVDQAWDPARRLLYAVRGDGQIAALTLYRSEQVAAWTRFVTAGAVRAVAVADAAYAVVERGATFRLERFAAHAPLDGALVRTAEAPQAAWSALEPLDGVVRVVADGRDAGMVTVADGEVLLNRAATTLWLGLPFVVEIAPLPMAADPAQLGQTAPHRLLEARFRLRDTPLLRVDTGRGPVGQPLHPRALDAPPQPFTGDCAVRALGWRRGTAPLWRIVQDDPFPLTLLAVTTRSKGVD